MFILQRNDATVTFIPKTNDTVYIHVVTIRNTELYHTVSTDKARYLYKCLLDGEFKPKEMSRE